MIKQSAADWCFYRQGDNPAEYYRTLRDLGYLGVEMVAPERWQAARESGLTLVNLTAPGMTAGLNRVEHHPQLLEQIRSLIKTAQEYSIEHLIIFSGNRAGQLDENGLRNTVAAGKALAQDAENSGIVLALEILNSYDHSDYQADGLEYIFEFCRLVGSPAIKSLVDLYHLQRMGGIDLDLILKNLESVAHIHIAGSPRRDFPGEADAQAARGDHAQEIAYAPIVRAIHQAGYRGYWGQEFLPGEDRFGELAQARKLFDSYASLVDQEDVK